MLLYMFSPKIYLAIFIIPAHLILASSLSYFCSSSQKDLGQAFCTTSDMLKNHFHRYCLVEEESEGK